MLFFYNYHNVGLISVPAVRFPGGVESERISTYSRDKRFVIPDFWY